jgi:hypothetical protein
MHEIRASQQQGGDYGKLSYATNFAHVAFSPEIFEDGITRPPY